MNKSIISSILFCGLCVICVGCTQKRELKTDYIENSFYEVEDILEFSVESGDIYVEMLGDNIVYNASEQALMLSDQNGESVSELFNLEAEQFICAIGHDNDQNILVMAEKCDEEVRQYEWMEVDITGKQKEKGEIVDVSFFPKSIIKDNRDRWILLSGDGVIFVYNMDSKVWQKIERKGFVESICLDEEGSILIVENVEDVYHIVKLENNLQNGEEKIVLNSNDMTAEIFMGQDGKQYYFEDNYLYCFDLNKRITQPVLCWIDVGLDAETIKKVSVSEEGCIYVTTEYDGQCVIKKLTPDKKMSDVREELVLACVGLNSVLQEQILKFNNESDDYRISIRDYAGEEDPYQVLNLDIITGKQFDIICMEGLCAQNYIEKGLLEDLSPYINVNDYVHAYIEAIKMDDSIYQVSPYFSIHTILGKTSDVGEEIGWTSEEMITFLEKNLDIRGLLYYDESDLFNVFIWSALNGYLQEDECGSHFQRESFRNTLEFVKNYQGYALKNENNTDIPLNDMIYGGELLLHEVMISSGLDYRTYKAMFHSDITAKGYPVANGSGNYMYLGMPVAICSNSCQKEAAWEFISYLFTDEMQYDLKKYGFPVKQKVLDELYDEWCRNGEIEDVELTITLGGNEKKVPCMDKKDIDNLKSIIESSAKLRVDSPELVNILREESKLYFQGQQDLENTIKYIEKRSDTYFEERN